MWRCGNISTSRKHQQGGRQPAQVTPLQRDWMRVPNLKFWSTRQRGVEAGRAHHCNGVPPPYAQQRGHLISLMTRLNQYIELAELDIQGGTTNGSNTPPIKNLAQQRVSTPNPTIQFLTEITTQYGLHLQQLQPRSNRASDLYTF